MKLKPIMSQDNLKTYNNARYNQNVMGVHLFYSNGEANQDKKKHGNLIIFSLMTISGYMDSIKNDNPNLTPKELLNAMIVNAESFVNNDSKEL